MEKSKIKFQRISKEQGITLIALVITIIILIILATVTINAVLGENGLIEQAKNTKETAEDSIEGEKEKLEELTQEYANLMAKEENIEEHKTVEDYKESGEVFPNKTTVEDEEGNKITIPEGFKIASDSGNTVQQGIVIEDVSASTDTEVQGSQFVWIPVGVFIKDGGEPSEEIILGRYTFSASSLGTPTLQQAAYTEDNEENYKTSKVIEIYYDEYSGPHRDGVVSMGADGLNATAYDLGAWINSVRTNGGYYIGRYEASFASGNSVENYKVATKISTDFSEDGMLYEEGTLWNYITQLDASKVAINTYEDSTSVKSDLMNSYAWDTAIVFIQECGHTDYANQDGESINSNLTNTGTGQDEVCKINDMASNLLEWTTEYSSYSSGGSSGRAFPCNYRGGSYNDSDSYTAERRYIDSSQVNYETGFRLTLYM